MINDDLVRGVEFSINGKKYGCMVKSALYARGSTVIVVHPYPGYDDKDSIEKYAVVLAQQLEATAHNVMIQPPPEDQDGYLYLFKGDIRDKFREVFPGLPTE